MALGKGDGVANGLKPPLRFRIEASALRLYGVTFYSL